MSQHIVLIGISGKNNLDYACVILSLKTHQRSVVTRSLKNIGISRVNYTNFILNSRKFLKFFHQVLFSMCNGQYHTWAVVTNEMQWLTFKYSLFVSCIQIKKLSQYVNQFKSNIRVKLQHKCCGNRMSTFLNALAPVNYWDWLLSLKG